VTRAADSVCLQPSEVRLLLDGGRLRAEHHTWRGLVPRSGDLLWVREKWAPLLLDADEDHAVWAVLYYDGEVRELPSLDVDSQWEMDMLGGAPLATGRPLRPVWRDAQTMPMLASRLTVAIVSIAFGGGPRRWRLTLEAAPVVGQVGLWPR
jgi:hypothetical protein